MIGVAFAALTALCGVAVVRFLRVPMALAPMVGLASIAIAATWATALGFPAPVRSALGVGLALVGLAVVARQAPRAVGSARAQRISAGLVAMAVIVVAVMFGFAFAGVEVPVSTHDGAFHVEMIDSLRSGAAIETWYPMGFHASVAAILGLLPAVDTARGTLETAQGLSLIAPLAVFGLGLALRLKPRVSATAALILSLTWTYPYDYQLWSGWPQGMSLLLFLGLLTTALYWLERPSVGLAILAGLFAGAIVLTHGTEVYSSVLALGVVGVAGWRRLRIKLLLPHVGLALAIAIVTMGPYLSALLGWVSGGGAVATGDAVVQLTLANADSAGRGDWLQLLLGATGAASFIDLPVRAALLLLGLRLAAQRLSAALWVLFVGLLVLVDFTDVTPVTRVFALTYPWLADDRPRQMAVFFASLLLAGGVDQCFLRLRELRGRLTLHPHAWRRIAIACALLLFFMVEGSGVSIYKRLLQGISEQSVYSSDDAAAMHWIGQHASAGDVVANDLAGDAGIWAPYKAHLPILLPRSASGSDQARLEPILENLPDLNENTALRTEACALHVAYLFHGASPQALDERLFPDRSVLEHAPGLQEVFASGEASVFRVVSRCPG